MKKIEENTVHLSVRELVEFVLRSGDIDTRRTAGPSIQDAMLVGANAHRRIQKAAGPDYEAEVPLSYYHEYEGDVCLHIDGRADGIFQGEHITIDEIKGIYKDIYSLEEAVPVHLAQAELYAYMYAEQEGLENIDVQITYVQLEEDNSGRRVKLNGDEIRRFLHHYTFEEIRERFLHYVNAFEKWSRFTVEHRKERCASLEGFSFPYNYRPGQKKIVGQVYRAVEDGRRLFVQAPTGTGKTLAMLYPAIQAVGQKYSDKIFYLTAKTVTGKAAEEAMTLMAGKGLKFSFIKITAKDKMCPLEKASCNPVDCPYAKGHFDRINDAIYDMISAERQITAEKISEYAAKHQVCPYEFSLDVSLYCDVIICDYNYAFSPHVYLQRYFALGSRRDYILLIDEAHNLADRARDMFSAEIVKEDLLAAKKLFEGRKNIIKWLEKANKTMLTLKRECSGLTIFTEDTFPNVLLDELMNLKDAMTRYLDRNPNPPNSEEIMDFFFRVSDFIDTASYVSDGYTVYGTFMENGSFFIREFCIDPSGRLRERLDQIRSTILFSATFLPINYYKELLTGCLEDQAVYVDSPFDPDKKALLIASDVSSRYTRRGENEYRKIASYIETMVRGSRGNYMAFFPSHKFLEDVLQYLPWQEEDSDVEILCQKRIMSEEDRADFLNTFTEDREKSLLGLCVTGGVFSEGIDLKNEALIGVAVVGTGLPQVCTERKLIQDYYTGIGENGFDYAYRYPGFNKVMQAAGRLIRTVDDYGVIMLLDERFLYRESLGLFPREWADFKAVRQDSAEEAVRHFWKMI